MQLEGVKIQMRYYEAQADTSGFLSAEDWEQEARRKLGAGPFGYVYGGAGAGDTMRANREAFYLYRIVPRICCDISTRDLTVELLGKKLNCPILLAPIGVNSILHPDAELGPARAAAKLEVPYILSNVSSKPMEEVAEAMGDGLRWFQMYPPRDRRLSASFMKRAEKAGYTAIVITVDSSMLGWRETDLHNTYLPFLSGHGMGNYFTDPVFLEKLDTPPEKDLKKAVLKALEEGNNSCFTWKEFAYLCEQTKLPVFIKGLMHPDDARLALDHGADGIVVSNHGGRQLDGAIGTLEALPDIVKAVNGKIPVLMDSGIRRGSDIIKAIALGATAVLIGRPYAYALAVAGQAGVEAVIQKFFAETEIQLGVSGQSRIQDVDASLLQKMNS